MYTIRNFLIGLALTLGCEAPTADPPDFRAPGFQPTRERLAGLVREELTAGTYTYVRLQLDGGDTRWVVLSGRTPRGAPRLAVDCHGRSREFVSPRLGRRFAPLHFCSPVPSTP